ncbi:MAG: hypothetical protein RRY22_04755 [Bacilli bacterium]
MNKKYIFSTIKEFLNSYVFNIILIFLIIMCFYGYAVTGQLDSSYIMRFNYILNYSWFFSGVFILSILVTNFYLMYQILNNTFVKIRLKKKHDLFNNVFLTIFISNTILFSVTLIILIIIGNFKPSTSFSGNYLFYNINDIYYLIYNIIKTFIITQLISFTNLVFVFLINSKTVLILNIVYVYMTIREICLDSIVKDFSLFFAGYIRMKKYNSFANELECFIAFVGIVLIIGIILINFVIFNKNGRKLDEEHFL